MTQDRIKESTHREQQTVVKPDTARRNFGIGAASKKQRGEKAQAICVTRALQDESRPAEHCHHRRTPVSALVIDVIVEARPQDRKRRHENKEPAAPAKTGEYRTNECLVVRHMLKHVQGVCIIQRFRLMFFHRRLDLKSESSEDGLIFRIRLDATDLQAVCPKHFCECPASRAEIDNLRGVRRFRGDNLVRQPAVVIPRALQQIEDVMSSILKQGAGCRERGWLKRRWQLRRHGIRVSRGYTSE